ncbi:hypothetical protein F4804DRAFT_327992 [Jackrogersella minutella]|nr:hypothetical protein F4804DRAFT_327992 [Jackrogersella minutella]
MALNEPHKSRIIGHMNKDHGAELSEYLRAFNGVSAAAARGAQIADMSLSAMTVTCASGAAHTVAITPPLGSAADARVRLVDMSALAQRRLGLSSVRVGAFTPPVGVGKFSFAGVTLYILALATYPLVAPGTAAWGHLDEFWPGGAAGYTWLVRALFVPVIIVHITEAWWLGHTRLEKHGVERWTPLWWRWTACTFVEGWPAVVRFDGLVEAETARKEGAKH